MKNNADKFLKEADVIEIWSVFQRILIRVNEKRKKDDRVTIMDLESVEACRRAKEDWAVL